jgi:hypothetical protein
METIYHTVFPLNMRTAHAKNPIRTEFKYSRNYDVEHYIPLYFTMKKAASTLRKLELELPTGNWEIQREQDYYNQLQAELKQLATPELLLQLFKDSFRWRMGDYHLKSGSGPSSVHIWQNIDIVKAFLLTGSNFLSIEDKLTVLYKAYYEDFITKTEYEYLFRVVSEMDTGIKNNRI